MFVSYPNAIAISVPQPFFSFGANFISSPLYSLSLVTFFWNPNFPTMPRWSSRVSHSRYIPCRTSQLWLSLVPSDSRWPGLYASPPNCLNFSIFLCRFCLSEHQITLIFDVFSAYVIYGVWALGSLVLWDDQMRIFFGSLAKILLTKNEMGAREL